MKKIFFLFTFLLFLLIDTKYAYASSFLKYENNPLNSVQSIIQNDHSFGFESHVILDQDQFKMWYTSLDLGYKIAYATSSDGITWNTTHILDLYSQRANHDPFILKKDGIYSLYFVDSNNGMNDFKIYRISSTDGIHFDENTRIKILEATQAWEANGVSEPSVFYENGTYYLLYTASSPRSDWAIGMATSTNGTDWTKCQNVIVENAGSPTLSKINNTYLFTFKTDSGIEQMQTTNLQCVSNWTAKQTIIEKGDSYDFSSLHSPSIVEKNNQTIIFYSARSITGVWTLNLASDYPIVAQNKKQIYVIVPGLMASWNKEAILHNQPTTQQDWKLNPSVTEYNGIIHTFTNLGLVQNQDFYVFPYDWRQPIEESAKQLASFIPPNTKVNLIGHSLGGLVATKYAEDHPNEINKIITVGSPHRGTAQVYRPLEAGEIDRWNNIMWIGEKIILLLNKNGVETDKQTIAHRLPVLNDLFPIYDFLIKPNGDTVPHVLMKYQNQFLQTLQNNISSIFNSLSSLSGEKAGTIYSFTLTENTPTDNLLGLYPDGRPLHSHSSQGDYVVTSYSAKLGATQAVLPLDHGELIYSKNGITKIVQLLGLNFTDSDIIEGAATTISPSLFFFIQSPITLNVIGPDGTTYHDQDGFIYVPNPKKGTYHIQVVGTGIGHYKITIGKITETEDEWPTIEGTITNLPHIDSYSVSFGIPENEQKFDELIQYIQTMPLTKQTRKSRITTNLQKLKQTYLLKSKTLQKDFFSISDNFADLMDQDNQSSFIYISEAYRKLENLYSTIFPYPQFKTLSTPGKDLIKYSQKLKERYEKNLKLKSKGKNIQYELTLYKDLFKDRLSLAQNYIEANQLTFAEIIIQSIKNIYEH